MSDLIGPALDAAVARAAGVDVIADRLPYVFLRDYKAEGRGDGFPPEWSPSTDWAIGGPIIEREKIELWYVSSGSICPGHWAAGNRYDTHHAVGASGPTPLIAAMRAFLAYKA